MRMVSFLLLTLVASSALADKMLLVRSSKEVLTAGQPAALASFITACVPNAVPVELEDLYCWRIDASQLWLCKATDDASGTSTQLMAAEDSSKLDPMYVVTRKKFVESTDSATWSDRRYSGVLNTSCANMVAAMLTSRWPGSVPVNIPNFGCSQVSDVITCQMAELSNYTDREAVDLEMNTSRVVKNK